MTPQDVQARVARVEAMAGDDGGAHSEEDRLYQDVLRAIAEGSPDAAALASVALRTAEVDFARWCA